MKEIDLTKGFKAIVDNEDFDLLSSYKWCVTKNGNSFYAKTTIGGRLNKRTLYMHRLIAGVHKKSDICDHRDGNGLNNQRSNIRVCTWAENQRNKRKKKNATSKFIGVTKLGENTWLAQITHEGKLIRIGQYMNEVDAAKAYDEIKRKLHGQFSQLNFTTVQGRI